VKTVLRRLQQLEERHSAWAAANDTSGARESIMASLRRMSERLRADPNWESMPRLTVEEIRAKVFASVSRYQSEGAE
jgi:hypothetical protein